MKKNKNNNTHNTPASREQLENLLAEYVEQALEKRIKQPKHHHHDKQYLALRNKAEEAFKDVMDNLNTIAIDAAKVQNKPTDLRTVARMGRLAAIAIFSKLPDCDTSNIQLNLTEKANGIALSLQIPYKNE